MGKNKKIDVNLVYDALITIEGVCPIVAPYNALTEEERAGNIRVKFENQMQIPKGAR